MLTANALTSSYGNREVLHQISFRLEVGETLCIIGANGSGKSTLLHNLMGLQKSTGIIHINQQELKSLSWKERAKKMALLSQHSSVEFPYTVFDTVALGRYCHKKNCFSQLNEEEIQLIRQCLENVGLWEERDQLISRLSGGQLQRVYLARTFAQNPQIILLDEPTNHLDLKVQLDLLQRLKKWVKDEHRGIIGVFHDLNFVKQFADKVLLLHNGNSIAYGSITEVMTQENLERAYQLDVCSYMEESYKNWVSPESNK